MDTKIADRLTLKYPLGDFVCEGKTKQIFRVKGKPDLAIIVSKDDLTAGDGAKHEIVPGKGRLANQTTVNVFRLLQAAGLPVTFVEQDSDTSFIALLSTMLPYEVVVRRRVGSKSSYLKRYPETPVDCVFFQPLVEFFLKTKNRHWKNYNLACDDPYMRHDRDTHQIELFHPGKPMSEQAPFLVLPEMEVFQTKEEWTLFPEMRHNATKAFLTLEQPFEVEGCVLADMKIECDDRGRISDTIDNDSWRVSQNGVDISKQMFRDGKPMEEVINAFHRVAEITGRFRLPSP